MRVNTLETDRGSSAEERRLSEFIPATSENAKNTKKVEVFWGVGGRSQCAGSNRDVMIPRRSKMAAPQKCLPANRKL